eukprot:1483306-Prymnesium_polylepis.2
MLACGVVGSAAFAPAVAPRSAAAPRVSVQMETLSDLKTLASGLNPVVGYWDPLKLAEAEFWDNTNEETIGARARRDFASPPPPSMPSLLRGEQHASRRLRARLRCVRLAASC